MNTLFNWVIFGIPWYVQTGILLAIFAAGLAVASGIIGIEAVKKIAVPVLGVVAALSLLSRAQQKGYQRKQAEDRQAQDEAIRKADKARREQEQRDNDPDHLRDDDGFERRGP